MDHLKSKYEIKTCQAGKIVHDAFNELYDADLDRGVDYEKIRKEELERTQELLEKALERNDLKTAVKAQDMINRLNGLYVEKQEVKAEIDTWTFKYGE